MATMTIRTTVAFDPATVARWERLAQKWGVSKSEALRRALESAENQRPVASLPGVVPDFTTMSPLQILDWLRVNPQVPPDWGANFRRELHEARDRDAAIEESREHEGIQQNRTIAGDGDS